MKSKQYWIDRVIRHDKQMQRDIKKIEKQLKKLFVDTNKEIKKELAYFYANQSNLTEYEKNRLEATLRAINTSLDNLFQQEEEKLNRHLIERYMTIYTETIEVLDVNIMFEAINEGLVEQIIRTNWSGLTFSERIWENRRRLALTIKEILTKGIARGDSLQDMANAIAKKMNASFSNAMTLVHTETCFVQNQATLDSYKEAQLVKYEFMAYLDSKTSNECRNMDGKIINIEDAVVGVNIPPLHPRCRSAILPVLE